MFFVVYDAVGRIGCDVMRGLVRRLVKSILQRIEKGIV